MGYLVQILLRSLASGNYRVLGRVVLCLHDPEFNWFIQYRVADRQTDRHMTTAPTVLA